MATNNDQPKTVFEGRTRNDLKHCGFLSNLLGIPFEDILKPVVFDESYYQSKPLPEDLNEFLKILEDKL